jgi:hypothetical protein
MLGWTRSRSTSTLAGGADHGIGSRVELELKSYYLPIDSDSGVEPVRMVRPGIQIPLTVKLKPVSHHSQAHRPGRGNRCFQPDFDLEHLAEVPYLK